MRTIGITTTVPAEILIAAGCLVVDLNNLFIGSDDPAEYLTIAENRGFPKNTCAWIKGLFGVCLRHEIREVVGVVEGDCSSSRALLDVFRVFGIRVHPFSYPLDRTYESLRASLLDLMARFGVTPGEAERVRQALLPVRALARRADELTWREGRATGFENHLLQIGLSDFGGDAAEYERMLRAKLKEIESRPARSDFLPLGYIGVPPMMTGLFSYAETRGARFVYNEVQREFAFPRADRAKDIFEQYRDYTYPYDLSFRLSELETQIQTRKLAGLVHYVQSSCHRAIDDVALKCELDLPILTIEGDRDTALDLRTRLRLDAFIDMLQDRRELS